MRAPMMLIAAWLLLSSGNAAAGDVHKCRDAQGQVSYSDKPCPESAHTESSRSIERAPSFGGIKPLCDGAERVPPMNTDTMEALRANTTAPQFQALQSMAYSLGEGRRDPATRWYRSRRGNVHICTRGANGNETEFVAGEDGEVILFHDGEGEWVNNPKSPLARLDQCTELITQCVERSPTTVDRCVQETPLCTDASSGHCCPQQCKQAYRSQRDIGTAPISAFRAVFFGSQSCVPEVAESHSRLKAIN